MTLYILAGGSDRKFDDYGKRIAAEVEKHVKNPKILSCFFASEQSTWQEKYEEWSKWFQVYFGNDSQYEIADAEIFRQQVEGADVVYFHGGNTRQLLVAMSAYKGVEELLAGKIVIGSSAGANYLARTGYSPSADTFIHGSGMVPRNVIVHYGAKDFGGKQRSEQDWLTIRARLEEFAGNRDITLLAEGDFVVVEQ